MKNRYLTAEQVESFDRDGFLHIPGVVPEDMLVNAQKPLEKFVEQKVQEWLKEGLISQDFAEEPFATRLNKAWIDAGQPSYNPNPTSEIISREIFDVIQFPLFVDVACDLIGSENVDSVGIFHCRPKLPNQFFTDTPWHQDAQCHPPMFGSKFIIMWTPLQDVGPENSCLEFAPGLHKKGLFPNYKDPNGYYISMHPDDVASLENTQPVSMKRGDLLCFNESVPHRAMPNNSDAARWSLDFRFEPHNNPHTLFKDRNFVCSHEDRSKVLNSYDEWFEDIWKGLRAHTE